MGDDSNLHFASQCIFFEFLVTGHKKRRGEGGMHRFLVAVYCDPDGYMVRLDVMYTENKKKTGFLLFSFFSVFRRKHVFSRVALCIKK